MTTNTTIAKLALALAKRQQAAAAAQIQQAEQHAAAAQDLMRSLAQDKLQDLRHQASPGLSRKEGEDLVREVFAVESMVRGVFEELKPELRGQDGRNVDPTEVEALVRAVATEMAPSLRGKDGQDVTPDMVAAAADAWLRANPPKDGESVTPEMVALAVAAYLAAHPPAAGKDGKDATPDMVAAAVAAYLKANPPKAGPPGPAPAHEVKGKKLRFKNPDGSWGSWIDIGGKGGIIYAPAAGPAGPAPNPTPGAEYTAGVGIDISATNVISAKQTFETISQNLAALDAEYAYNAAGQLVTVTYDSGAIVKQLTYNEAGQLTLIELSGAGLPAGIATQKQLTYNAAGQLVSTQYT